MDVFQMLAFDGAIISDGSACVCSLGHRIMRLEC